MGPDLIPSGRLDPAVRQIMRLSTSVSVALVIATIVLAGIRATSVLTLAAGIVAAGASMGVALWAALA